MPTQELEAPDAELVSRLNTAYRKILVVGKTVFVPPIFSARRIPFQFHVRQLRLLYHLTQTTDFDKACELAEIGRTAARKFLKSPDYLEFAAEAVYDQAVQDGWTPRRVVVELNRIYSGEVAKGENQMDALKMLKDMVCPKKSDGSHAGGVTVNLNFPVLSNDVRTKLKQLADEAATIDVEAA